MDLSVFGLKGADNLEEGEHGYDKTMFALFEAGLQRNANNPNPMLRRYAPCVGLTMWHLSEVLIG